MFKGCCGRSKLHPSHECCRFQFSIANAGGVKKLTTDSIGIGNILTLATFLIPHYSSRISLLNSTFKNQPETHRNLHSKRVLSPQNPPTNRYSYRMKSPHAISKINLNPTKNSTSARACPFRSQNKTFN